jgi:hypothetical protein
MTRAMNITFENIIFTISLQCHFSYTLGNFLIYK